MATRENIIAVLGDTPTTQQIFDYVVKHLIKQGVPSMDDRLCWYRGPNGTMCAVGCLIPDELYNCCLEGLGTISETVLSKIPFVVDPSAAVLPESVKLLMCLQSAHDSAAKFNGIYLEHLTEKLHHVARTYGLNADAITYWTLDLW